MYKGDYEMHHNAADAAMNMITWYRLTHDDKWMRAELYPFLKEIADNSTGFLIRDGKRYVVSSCVAELDCNHRLNATQAIAFTARVLQSLIEMSKQLDLDADLRPRWQEMLDRICPVPLVTVDGQRCLSFSEDDPSVTANGAPYPLQSFYPALWFNRESPEALYARNLIDYLYRHNELGKGDVFRAHFFTWLVPPAIRCGYPAEDVLKVIRSVVDKTMLPNFTYWDQALLTEHQVIDGIAAMFLQSFNGRLIIFPNWTMHTAAAFHQLREDGAFLVSAATQQGIIGPVTILSEKGFPAVCRTRGPAMA
jgi:alpha-L-fucosidase 2